MDIANTSWSLTDDNEAKFEDIENKYDVVQEVTTKKERKKREKKPQTSTPATKRETKARSRRSPTNKKKSKKGDEDDENDEVSKAFDRILKEFDDIIDHTSTWQKEIKKFKKDLLSFRTN